MVDTVFVVSASKALSSGFIPLFMFKLPFERLELLDSCSLAHVILAGREGSSAAGSFSGGGNINKPSSDNPSSRSRTSKAFSKSSSLCFPFNVASYK
jgi:hypothetical protein